jgi:hypothetical protein
MNPTDGTVAAASQDQPPLADTDGSLYSPCQPKSPEQAGPSAAYSGANTLWNAAVTNEVRWQP